MTRNEKSPDETLPVNVVVCDTLPAVAVTVTLYWPCVFAETVSVEVPVWGPTVTAALLSWAVRPVLGLTAAEKFAVPTKPDCGLSVNVLFAVAPGLTVRFGGAALREFRGGGEGAVRWFERPARLRGSAPMRGLASPVAH